MSTTFWSTFLTSILTLMAYMAVPLLFAIIYPNRLRVLFCAVFTVIHGALIYWVFSIFGFETSLALYLAIAEAILWTAVAVLLMYKLSSFKEVRTAEFTYMALPWYRRDIAVRAMLTALMCVELLAFSIKFAL